MCYRVYKRVRCEISDGIYIFGDMFCGVIGNYIYKFFRRIVVCVRVCVNLLVCG